MNDLLKLVDQILNEVDYKHNPYFTALMNKEFAKDDFIETQIQFFSAVTFFSRPMAALSAKIPFPALRMEIVRNVWEEHGEGNFEKTHDKTFRELLLRLGNVQDSDIDKRALWPEVRVFNTTLVGACVVDEYLIGVGVMGMIERMFVDISNIIGQGIVHNGWLTEDNMIHYNLHKVLDIRHSADFFNVLKPSWEESETNRYYIEQGLRMGAEVFNYLYWSMYTHRKIRIMRSVSGLHARA
ncbi:MAG: iron-containing redox enzyme family protein [Bacteriovorax sp.]|nr:iron-containing redox enzyme family protein [Bacteriovorax sp.]